MKTVTEKFYIKRTKENILNHNITFILNELLTSTYDAAFIDDTYPTCSVIAGRLTKKYAIKTGTTDTDLWAIGYNKDVIVGVWNGYDDNKTAEVKDYQGAKYIWADTIEQYLKDKPSNWYEIPSNVVGVLVNPITGNLATENDKNKKIFYFIKGTEPYSNDENLDKVFNER